MARLSRRAFLIAGGATGGALLGGVAVGVGWLATVRTDGLESAVRPDGTVALNAWVAIDPDGTVRCAVPVTELGQGTHTGCAQLIAEELAIDPERHPILVRHPDEELPAYANWALALGPRPEDGPGLLWWVPHKLFAALPFIVTGGSTGIVNHWHTLRVAGASARAMLVAAAARRWQVPIEQCIAADGAVSHRASGARAAYGDLAIAAAAERPRERPPLKDASAFQVIGQPIRRLDVPAKVTGQAIFGIDVRLPDMLYAAIRHCPVLGGRIAGYDAARAKKMLRVVEVVDLGDAVAVVAERSHWYARQAVDAIDLTIAPGEAPRVSSAGIAQEMQALLDGPEAHVAESKGDVEEVFANSERTIRAVYRTPFLTHACMEPMNCTALSQDGMVEFWYGTQSPLVARWAAGRSPAAVDRVKVHVPYAGGGFGRRADALVATEATTLAALFPGRPVQLLWSREDDIRAGFYRAASLNRLEAAIDRSGTPTAWRHRIVTQSLGQGFGERNLPFGGDDPATDHNSVAGAVGLAYDLDNLSVELVSHASPVPIGYWRCNAHFNNALANECFLDECAAHAGQDPYQLRRRLVRERPRHLQVLDTAAERADWGSPLAAGRGRGIALHASFGSIVAVVIEASVGDGGELAVERAVVAIDCGVAVNPDSIRAQAEGSVVWALSAALLGEITLEDGQIEQSNFHDYQVLRNGQAPRTETVIIEGDDRPGGVGEPIVPPVAPALLNAIFAATGRRLRRLPIAEPTTGKSDNGLRLRDYLGA